MYQFQEISQEIKRVLKRRKRILIFTPVFITLVSFGVTYLMVPKYTSSTTILVQKEETLNPLILYNMAVNIASENRLKSFNEIVYSRSTIELLIDSLDLSERRKEYKDRIEFIDAIKQNVQTNARTSDSFQITYFDKNPIRARDGAELLASHFIKTRITLENKRNEETVKFFQKKLDELEIVVGKSRKEMLSNTQEQVKQTPTGVTSLQNNLGTIQENIEDLDWKIFENDKNQEILKQFLNQKENRDFELLYKVSLTDIPSSQYFKDLLSEYDEYKQQYTDNYPRMQELKDRIVELADRILLALQDEKNMYVQKRGSLVKQKNNTISKIQESYVATKKEDSNQSDFSVYESMYNDMKAKLEQAKMTRDLGKQAAEQFIVLDPPYIPENPTSPNVPLITAAGFILGIFLGIILAALTEVLDTTIRFKEDLEYQKPVIAYISDGNV